jgi:hypothetical protein
MSTRATSRGPHRKRPADRRHLLAVAVAATADAVAVNVVVPLTMIGSGPGEHDT